MHWIVGHQSVLSDIAWFWMAPVVLAFAVGNDCCGDGCSALRGTPAPRLLPQLSPIVRNAI